MIARGRSVAMIALRDRALQPTVGGLLVLPNAAAGAGSFYPRTLRGIFRGILRGILRKLLSGDRAVFVDRESTMTDPLLK